ncbi:MAG: SpoIIE family protein phosphatase [Actinomycetota bacterium]
MGNAGTPGTTERLRDVEHAAYRVLAEAESLAAAAPEILSGIAQALHWDVGALWTVDRDGQHLRLTELWRRDLPELADFEAISRGLRMACGEGIPGRVWQSGEPLWIPDVNAATYPPRGELARTAGLGGAFGFPVVLDGAVYGVIEFFSHTVQEPDAELLAMVAAVGLQLGEFIKRERVIRELALQNTILENQGEAALDAIGVIAPDLQIVYWNQRLLDMFGLTESEVEEGDATVLIGRLIERTADPKTWDGIAETVLSDRDAEVRLEAPFADGQVIDAWTAPIRGPEGTLYGRVLYCRDITESKRNEEQHRRNEEWLSFLTEATTLLSESLDYRVTLQRFADLAVPLLGDWCAIHILEADGSILPVAIANRDKQKLGEVIKLSETYQNEPNSPAGVAAVIRTQSPELYEEVTDEFLQATAQNDEHLACLRSLGLRSAMFVPLVCRGRSLGAITLASTDSGRRYDKEDLRRAEELASRAAFPIDNARLYERSAVIARTLQNSLLPPDLPRIPGTELTARYIPAGEGLDVGGDFYDVFQTGRRSWGIVVGDVTGKGVEAATITAFARHTIRTAAMTTDRPSEILNILNRGLLEDPKIERFCTALYARIDTRFARVRVTLSGAGHPLPYIVRSNGKVEQVQCKGTLLGFSGDITFDDMIVELDFGDKLFLYTDGVIDIRHKGRTLGGPGLLNLLDECGKRGTEASADLIVRTVLALQDGRPRDDIALVVLGVRASIFRVPPRRLRDQLAPPTEIVG